MELLYTMRDSTDGVGLGIGIFFGIIGLILLISVIYIATTEHAWCKETIWVLAWGCLAFFCGIWMCIYSAYNRNELYIYRIAPDTPYVEVVQDFTYVSNEEDIYTLMKRNN